MGGGAERERERALLGTTGQQMEHRHVSNVDLQIDDRRLLSILCLQIDI